MLFSCFYNAKIQLLFHTATISRFLSHSYTDCYCKITTVFKRFTPTIKGFLYNDFNITGNVFLLGLLALLWVGDVGKALVDGRHYDTGRDGVDTDVFPPILPTPPKTLNTPQITKLRLYR